jgi:hypothetical protein
MRRYIVSIAMVLCFCLTFLTSCSYFMEDKIDEPRPKDPAPIQEDTIDGPIEGKNPKTAMINRVIWSP